MPRTFWTEAGMSAPKWRRRAGCREWRPYGSTPMDDHYGPDGLCHFDESAKGVESHATTLPRPMASETLPCIAIFPMSSA